ncbi:MAG: hypothetical protein KIH63_005205 [Candidatus Saccharibacteria bacterium]|nr:hypothetical protein [Candidatus Saccharibacteria bacterium]
MNIHHLLAQLITESELNIPKGGLTNSRVRTSLSVIFGIAGSLAVLVIVVAGLRYVAAAGDPKGAAKARNAIIFAVVGLVVSAIAFSIVTFVIGKL